MFKKSLSVLTLAGLLLSATQVSAHNGIHLNYNGMDVEDPSAHMADNGSVYVSVEVFAKFYGATAEWDGKDHTLKINGVPVEDTYGAANEKKAVASVRALTAALGGSHSSIGWEPKDQTVNVTIMPEGTVQLTPDVPQMGEHWGKPTDMPIGPIYGVHNGKLVFIELMLAKDLQKTVHDIPGSSVPLPSGFDHEDIDWNPQGHDGFTDPHYDVHFYYILREEQNQIMPSGPVAGHEHMAGE